MKNQPVGNHGVGIFWCMKSAYNSFIIGPRGLEW